LSRCCPRRSWVGYKCRSCVSQNVRCSRTSWCGVLDNRAKISDRPSCEAVLCAASWRRV